MTTTTTEAFETGLRAEFEAWANTRALRLARDEGDGYRYIQTDEAWQAYRAATERAAKLCDRLGGDIDMRNPDDVKIAANSLAAAIRASSGKGDCDV